MQGLGSGAITLDGTPGLKARYLPRVASGEAIAAFALSEPDAGSDVAAMSTTARRDGDHWVLDGEKTWISNGGIADFYVVFARQVEPGAAPEARGTKSIAAFVVDADTPGLRIAERLDTMAPHPLARLAFDGCRIPASQCLAEAGAGFKLAMRTLDVFRTSVAAAALGFARRALAEGLARATTRPMFGQHAVRAAADAGQAGRHGAGGRRRRAAHLPRRVAPRPGPHRRRARPRWPSWRPPRARSA